MAIKVSGSTVIDDSRNADLNSITLGGVVVNATAAELNALNGLTASTAELNTLDGLTSTTTELNTLDGLTSTTTELNYLDGVTSPIQTQLDNISVTNATLTKSFVSGETSTIALSQAISAGAPVVSVTKEVPQTGLTSNTWDVATDGANYDRHDTAYATTLTPSNATGDGTFTLGTGSFASTDVGKTIEGNGGEAILTATDGSYSLVTAFNDTSTIASGDWSMYATVFDATNGLELSGGIDVYNIEGGTYDNIQITPTQTTYLWDVDFKPDGTKMYVVDGYTATPTVYQYTLSTPWDASTYSYDNKSFNVANQISQFAEGLKLSPDGTKMYVSGRGNNAIYQYNLSTAWDVSTASYDDSLSVGSGDVRGFCFGDSGSTLAVAFKTGDAVETFNLTVPFDLTGGSASSGSFGINGCNDVEFNSDGTKVFVMTTTGSIQQYSTATPWSVSSMTSDGVFLSNTSSNEGCFTFGKEGQKLYTAGGYDNNVRQHSVGTGISLPTAQYTPAITNTNGQINSTYWTDINSMTTTQVAGDGQVYYAVSTDGRTTWKVIDDTNGERSIVRDNAGTWQYNSNTTYGSVTWTNATTNEELYALQEALSVTQNRMDQTQLEAVTDANHYTLGDNLDLMIALYLGSASASIPSSDGVSINYDANVKNEGAVLGTDYDFDFPATDVVRVTSNSTNNLKIRVV